MTNSGEKAFMCLLRFLHEKKMKGEAFSLYEVEEYVKAKAGTLLLAPGRRVRDYIEDKVDRGELIELHPYVYCFRTSE